MLSFGFKFGVPYDADLMLDVRFLPNPHFVPGLREKTGLEDGVKNFVLECPDTDEFLKRSMGLLEYLLPRYQQEGKRYLSIALGCTGGRHRSVCLAVKIAADLKEKGYNVNVRHRDIDRPNS